MWNLSLSTKLLHEGENDLVEVQRDLLIVVAVGEADANFLMTGSLFFDGFHNVGPGHRVVKLRY